MQSSVFSTVHGFSFDWTPLLCRSMLLPGVNFEANFALLFLRIVSVIDGREC